MFYSYLSGFFAFCSIVMISIYAVMVLNKKKITFETFFYKKSFDENIEITTQKLIYLIFGKSNLNELSTYLNLLEYRVSSEKIAIYSTTISSIFSVVFFMILVKINILLAIASFIIFIMFGTKISIIYLKMKYENIQEEKRLGILPYVEMLQVASEAGLTLTLAIERIYEYYPTPLALEFKKANNDFMTNVKTRSQSLYEIIDRVGGDEIRFLIESIMQALDTGTPMRNTLKTLANTIRRETRKRILDMGQKAKWKNFIISICVQFPPFIFIIAGPSMVGLLGSL